MVVIEISCPHQCQILRLNKSCETPLLIHLQKCWPGYNQLYGRCDQVQVTIDECEYEIKRYEQCRLVCASKATWIYNLWVFNARLLPDTFCSFAERAACHIPANPDWALPAAARTPLITHFLINFEEVASRNILYCNFPEHFTWKKNRW